ncbi:MAG: DUF3604 domain-containing protein [Myxococcota bacterium]
MPLLPHTADRYLRMPQLEVQNQELWLSAIEWTVEGEAVLRIPLDAAAAPLVDRAERSSLRPAILGLEDGKPTEDPDFDARAVDGRATCTIVRRGGGSEVICTLSGRDVRVWRAEATAAAPAVVAVEEGAWVAFHHNLREDDGRPDLAKWIALRFVRNDGEVFEPAGPMTDRDRDLAGEDQSFEFPSLAVGPDGAVALFGRGSHRFYRQDVDGTGYHSREGIDPEGWGCRGQGVAVRGAPAPSPTTGLVVAYRGRKGIVTELLPIPTGTCPRLAPASVEPPCRPAIVAVATGPDPAARDGRMTLFGDIQQHSSHSDGIGSADEPYLRGRYSYGDDFAALTDHESFLGKRIGPGEWRYLQAVADRHNDPGEFATIIAYEWTGKMHPGPGHKVVYLPRTGLPIVSRDDVPVGKDLVTAIAEQGAFTGPHHIGWTGADFDAHREDGQPVWEICSCHGCYEYPDHPLGQRGELRDQMADAALRAGLRFGFIANSDSHGLLYHHGECRKRDPFRTGLTAVQARARTREAIFEAVAERRCYATSGAKILLDFRVAGAPMGSELPERGPHPIEALARGTELTVLEVVGADGAILEARDAGTDALELRGTVEGPFVYARATQKDGEMAWSSPVFLGPKPADLSRGEARLTRSEG